MITGASQPTTKTQTESLQQQINNLQPGAVKNFFLKMLPVSEYVNSQTGISRRLLLAQYADETAYGTQMSEPNNYGNIGVFGGGSFPSWSSPMAFAKADAAYYNDNSRYQPLEAAGKSGQTIATQAVLLGKSGYASGEYGGPSAPGSDLISIVNQDFGPAGATGAGQVATLPSGQKQTGQTQGGITDWIPWDTGPGSIYDFFNDVVASTIDNSAQAVAGGVLTGVTAILNRIMLVALFGIAALILFYVLASKAGVSLPVPVPV